MLTWVIIKSYCYQYYDSDCYHYHCLTKIIVNGLLVGLEYTLYLARDLFGGEFWS